MGLPSFVPVEAPSRNRLSGAGCGPLHEQLLAREAAPAFFHVLAQALVSRPRYVLVDELSLGLAPIVVQRLVPVLESVAANGVGVLLIEQFAHVALGLAQTAYVLERGRIHYHGTARRRKDEPELLQSAYLLRDVDPGGEALETLS